MDYIEYSVVQRLTCLSRSFVNIISIIVNKKIVNIRRWWTKPHLKEPVRQTYGAYATIFTYFKLFDHEEFKIFTRMSVPEFAYLYHLVEPYLRKRSRRTSLPPELRLAAVLQ